MFQVSNGDPGVGIGYDNRHLPVTEDPDQSADREDDAAE